MKKYSFSLTLKKPYQKNRSFIQAQEINSLQINLNCAIFCFDKIIVTFDNTKEPLKLTDSEMEEAEGSKEVINGHDEKNGKEEIFTSVVRAGKRTYFFDVKATRKDDFYLTITESKKRLGKEGKVFYEKHKIFLYKEDFEKFSEGLKESIAYIGNGKAEVATIRQSSSEVEDRNEKDQMAVEEFTNVEFEDLGKK